MKNLMRISLLALIPAALLSSCSNEEVTDINMNATPSGEISFSAFTPGNTRAANVYCSANPLEDFQVYALTDKGVFMNNVTVTKNGSDYETADKYYWPETGDVTFYGAKNGSFVWGAEGEAPTFDTFTVAEEAKNQVDLMYARTTGSKAATGEDAVKMNFRHALAQVVFQAQNVGKDLDITFSGVTVANVTSSGKYTFPTVNTDANLQHPSPSADVTDNSRGSWSSFGEAKNFSVKFDEIKLEETNKIYSLTTNAEGEEYNDNTLLLIPNSELTAWDTTAELPMLSTGTYFILDATVVQKAHNEGEVDNVIYDGKIYLSADFSSWKEGVRYVYTFVFGKGNGGHDDKNKPVLVPISFTCDIDEFIPQDEEVDMKTK